MSYDNKHVLRGGAISLYTRNGRPTFHCRLKLDGHKGYIIKSTKRTSLIEAARVAEDLYDDLRYKIRHGLEVKPHTFESMWKRWLTSNKGLLSAHRIRYIEGTANRYFLPYFGSMSLEQMSDANVAGYWEWRLNYWSCSDPRFLCHLRLEFSVIDSLAGRRSGIDEGIEVYGRPEGVHHQAG